MQMVSKIQQAADLLKNISCGMTLSIEDRQRIIEKLVAPVKLGITGSALLFYAHSVTEDARIRKFKEAWTIEWLRALPPGAVLYDVGANIGVTSLIAVENKSKNVCVVAIEPAPANFASLVKNIELNGFTDTVYALPLGLGNVTDIADFKLTTLEPGGAMHSFGEFVTVKPDNPRQQVASISCLRMQLDDLVNLKGLPFPTHMKIDIDGGELELLAGANKVFRDPRLQAAQVEVVDMDSKGDRSKQLIAILSSMKFSVVARYEHNENYPRVTDIQFVRSSAFCR